MTSVRGKEMSKDRVASGECTSSKAVSIKQKAEPATWGQSQRLRNLDCSLSLNPGAVFTDQVMLQLCLKSSSGYFSWVAIWNLSDFHIYYDLALIFSSFFFLLKAILYSDSFNFSLISFLFLQNPIWETTLQSCLLRLLFYICIYIYLFILIGG